MWVVKDVPEAIYGLPISSRLIANHALHRSQRKREKRVATALQRQSNRLGTDEFAESHNHRGISEVTRWEQILPQQILRHLDGLNNEPIRSHAEERQRDNRLGELSAGLFIPGMGRMAG